MASIDLEDYSTAYVAKRPLVYIGCSLTSEDCSGLREHLLEGVERLFSAHGFDVYNPCRHTMPGSPHDSREVYAIDHLNAMRAQLIFFIRIQPSLGMGIEAQIAADMLIPWADARIASFELTPLVAGLPNPSTGDRFYFDPKLPDDFLTKLEQRLKGKELRQHVLEVNRGIEPARQIIRQIGIGHAIRRQRLILNMSAEELGSLVDISPWWIESIEGDLDLSLGLTLGQLARLITATRLRFVAESSCMKQIEFPALRPARPVHPDLFAAADEFATYSLRRRNRGEPSPESDSEMLVHWRCWLASKRIALPPRTGDVGDSATNKLRACVTLPLSNLGEADKQVRDRIIGEVQNVLLRFRGVEFEVRLPDLQRTNREDLASAIYMRALARLGEADFGIVVATPAATGVGITTKLFANATMPYLCLAQEGAGVSRMFRGVYCPRIGEIVVYGPSTSVAAIVEQTLAANLPHICESAVRRRAAWARIVETDLTKAIDRYRIPRKTSRDETIRKIEEVPHIRGEWLRDLAKSPLLLPSVTLLQFVHIANQLDWRISVANTGIPCFYPRLAVREMESELTTGQAIAAERSLDNLVDAIGEASRLSLFGADDRALFDEWEKYQHELTLTAADFETGELVRTQKQWLEVLLGKNKL